MRSLFIISLLLVAIQAHVKRDADKPTSPLLIDAKKFDQHLDQFRNCIDQHLANVVGDVQANQLQPVLNVVGDQVYRLSKAWDILTAPKSTTPPDDE